ncbi:MAG TPA: hypothetical protein VNQ79_06655 [Blastocatellia bacterium]|nr:hypothetical protein [Blastocatellia bacterium]
MAQNPIQNGAESCLRNLRSALINHLPAALDRVAAQCGPVRFLRWDNASGRQTEAERTGAMEAPREIWCGASPRLNFPSLTITRTRTSIEPQSDEDLSAFITTHSFEIDLALADADADALAFVYERYLAAIRLVIAEATLEERLAGLEEIAMTDPVWLAGDDALLEAGQAASGSLMIRRGTLQVTIAH